MKNALIALQARAAREYGIPWEVFDTVTPFELAQIAEDYRRSWIEKQKIQDARFAKLTTAVYTLAGAKVKESDFMPDYGDKPAPKNQTNEELITRIKIMFGMMSC